MLHSQRQLAGLTGLAERCFALSRGCPGALAGGRAERWPQEPPGTTWVGMFPCCSMQEDLDLIDEIGGGLHGKQDPLATFLGKRWGSQTFNKLGKDLTTAFTVRREHTHAVIVSV